MMGERQVDQGALFYRFSLDRHVPANHLLRAIDRFVDLEGVRAHLAPFYSSTGRPSIDPELLVRMLLVGYCYGIRSERRLCEEVHLNLAYRWFCRLGLDGEVPDHSTFSKNRHGRFRDCDLLRKLFETVVRRCMAEGLVGGTAFAVDASLIAADANKQRSAAGSDDVDWDAVAKTRRSVREYLDTLDEAAWGAASETVPKFISRSDPRPVHDDDARRPRVHPPVSHPCAAQGLPSHPPLRLVRQRQPRRDDHAGTRTPGPGRACVRRSRRDRSGDRPANRPALPPLWRPHVCHRDLRGRLPATTPSNRASRRNQDRHLMSADAASRTRIVKRASRWSKPSHGDARPHSDPSALSTALSVMEIILFAAQAGPRPTSGHYHVAATLLRLASTAIKSP